MAKTTDTIPVGPVPAVARELSRRLKLLRALAGPANLTFPGRPRRWRRRR